ncbi:MAG: hypothetical protein RL199_270 [Pseudomonadota bacterium]|jgi:hypothetical protein
MRRVTALLLAMTGCVAEAPPSSAVPATLPPPTTPPWRPVAGTTWQIQLDGTPDLKPEAAVYDVDLFEAPDETFERLRGLGRRVVCYFNAGAFEPWRPDATAFPSAALGRPLAQWRDERWLDIRSDGVRRVLEGRLDLAASRGCDGVDPDNVDGFSNATGFPLDAADQLDFNRFLAGEARARGLAVGLKNNTRQMPWLVADYDFAVVEECFRFRECDRLRPFIEAGKAVFEIEYGGRETADRVCPDALRLGLSALVMPLGLDGSFRISCR